MSSMHAGYEIHQSDSNYLQEKAAEIGASYESIHARLQQASTNAEEATELQSFLKSSEAELFALQSSIQSDLVGRHELLTTFSAALPDAVFAAVYATAGWPVRVEKVAEQAAARRVFREEVARVRVYVLSHWGERSELRVKLAHLRKHARHGREVAGGVLALDLGEVELISGSRAVIITVVRVAILIAGRTRLHALVVFLERVPRPASPARFRQ